MASVDLSTIGILFGWAVQTTAGTKPAAFTRVEEVKAIGGIALEADQIEVTPLDTDTRRYVAGLKDTGGTWSITMNLNDTTKAQWEALKTASTTAKASNLATWAEVYIPGMADACFVTFEPGDVPLMEVGVGEALEAEISNIINEYKGWSTKVLPAVAT